MAEEKAKTGRQLGHTGETVRRNIRWIRDDRGISGAELSQTVGRLGRPIPLLGIQRIEAGTRRVDVDDLMAIAVALGVSPSSLLMPMRHDSAEARPDAAVPSPGDDIQADEVIEITGWRTHVSAHQVWEWLAANVPLVQGTMSSFIQFGLPGWERRRREDIMRYEFARRMERPTEGLEGYSQVDFDEDSYDGND